MSKTNTNTTPILTFDCYGTLLDTRPFYALIESEARKAGLDPKEATSAFCRWEDRLMYGEPYCSYEEILRKALAWCDWEFHTDVFEKLHAKALDVHRNFKPFADVVPVLKQLKEKGYQICLMSNTTDELIKAHHKALEDLPDEWLSAEMTHCYKPDLSFFRQAETQWNLKNRPHIHVAKGYWWDMSPAAKMDWRAVWVNRSNEPVNPDLVPDAIISDLTFLMDQLS